ncbi:MAG: fibrillarin-like rRNA/tRNA 2'-O-methyltransferase [Candidatus Methanoperedens sp.]|nr:fibrillarin-like rRNA/tRNA 2'-O-methyltransferase [Candidatus Methanoperedens sp.]
MKKLIPILVDARHPESYRDMKCYIYAFVFSNPD